MSCNFATLDGIGDDTELEKKQITLMKHLAIDIEDDNDANEEWSIVLRNSDILKNQSCPEKDNGRTRPRLQIDLTRRSYGTSDNKSRNCVDWFAFAICLILIAGVVVYSFISKCGDGERSEFCEFLSTFLVKLLLQPNVEELSFPKF